MISLILTVPPYKPQGKQWKQKVMITSEGLPMWKKEKGVSDGFRYTTTHRTFYICTEWVWTAYPLSMQFLHTELVCSSFIQNMQSIWYMLGTLDFTHTKTICIKHTQWVSYNQNMLDLKKKCYMNNMCTKMFSEWREKKKKKNTDILVRIHRACTVGWMCESHACLL